MTIEGLSHRSTEIRLRAAVVAVPHEPYASVAAERVRAFEKFDTDDHAGLERRHYGEAVWLRVLLEEVGEVADAQNEYEHGNLTVDEYRTNLRAELVQVAAMASAWVDAIDDYNAGLVRIDAYEQRVIQAFLRRNGLVPTGPNAGYPA